MLEHSATNELHTQIQYRLVEKLTESERRYRELVENLREIVFECDHQGHLTFINKAWTETLGYSAQDAMGQPLGGFIHNSDVDIWQSLLEHKADSCSELRFCHQNGDIRWLELSVRFNRNAQLSGSLINITERKSAATILKKSNEDLEIKVQQRAHELIKTNKALEKTLHQLQQTQGRLIQQEKMSGLGQLVAGVAHEINNPVSFIYGNIPHLHNYVQDLLGLVKQYQHHYPHPVDEIQSEVERIDLDFIREDVSKVLSSINTGSDRISEIVKSLRSFSRLDESEIKRIDIHEGLDNTLVILNHRLRNHANGLEIQVIKDYASLPIVECYAGLINQVFLSILTNAIEALEEQTKKSKSQDCCDKSGQILLKTSLIKDNWIQVEIADTGPGISSEIQKRIFEPFFTTKRIGDGTGMGLSISHQIITEQHGGTLECLSTLGKGTQFMIRIPVMI